MTPVRLLALRRETFAELTAEQLAAVVAGAPTIGACAVSEAVCTRVCTV